MSDAEIERLINVYDDSSNDCCDDHVVLMGRDYLALKAAVRITGRNGLSCSIKDLANACAVINAVMSEQEPPHAE